MKRETKGMIYSILSDFMEISSECAKYFVSPRHSIESKKILLRNHQITLKLCQHILEKKSGQVSK